MSQALYQPVAARPAWIEARLRALAGALALAAPTRRAFLFLPDETFYASCTESIVSLQGATARIVRHLGLRCDRVVVTFVSNLPAAAHIEYDAGSWYVEIDSRWRGDARSLGAILAHEVCHILVRERGLPRFGTAVDEVHVDLAVMLSGLGALTLNGNRETSEHSGDTVTTRRWAFGYLSPGLLVHAYALVVGSLRVEQATAPLLDLPTRFQVWMYAGFARFRAPLSYGPAGPGFVPCLQCDKVLRVPPAKQGRARCPACGAEQAVDGRVLRVGPPASGALPDAPLPVTSGVQGLLLRASVLWQGAPTSALFLVAMVGLFGLTLAVQKLNLADLGETCQSDADCQSGRCLFGAPAFAWEAPRGPGTCTKECTIQADCPEGLACADAELVDYFLRFSEEDRKRVRMCVPVGE